MQNHIIKAFVHPACRCYLLLRFYDPTGGAIYLDGHDLRDLSVASLRGHVAMVWQEPFLLDDSVHANLLSVILRKPYRYVRYRTYNIG